MEPQRVGAQPGADRAPEIVTGWFMGSVVGYRLMVGWMVATLAMGAGGLLALLSLANEIRLLRLILEGR